MEYIFNQIKQLQDPYKGLRDFNGTQIYLLKILNFLLNKIIFLFFKIFNLKLLPIPTEAIGHQTFDIECFLFEKKKKNLKFVPIICNSGKFMANSFLFDEYQKNRSNFLVIKNNFLATIFFYQRRYKNITYDTSSYQQTYGFRKMHTIFKKESFIYKLSSIHYKLAVDLLIKYKINIKRPFVVIHARDSTYKRYDGESYRNTNINSFKKSVNWLLSKNFQIIRIGNRGMNRCSYAKKIIDLTTYNMNQKDKEILDLFFIQECYFFIGSASGPYTLASMFNKPMLLVNMCPLGNVFPCAKRGIVLPKLYMNKISKKFIMFKDILNFNFSHLRLDREFETLNIKLIDNTSEEILAATTEIYKKVLSNDFRESFAQKRFKKIFNKKIHDSANSMTSISDTFIKEYKNLL
jgi:putative glycosyltransferase (TIGR04372 family)